MMFAAAVAVALQTASPSAPTNLQPGTYRVSSTYGAFLATECAEHTGMVASFCSGYVFGIYDAMSRTRNICPPEAPGESLIAVSIAKKYIADHPERWHQHGSQLVSEAFRDAYPCHLPQKGPKGQ